MRWYLIVVLICILISDAEHLFMYLLPSVCLLQKKCFLKPSAHFLIWLVFIFFFCYWVVGVLCIFWILIPYQIHNLQILSRILQVAFSFCWWRRFFCAETFYFNVVPLIFAVNAFAFSIRSKRSLPRPMLWSLWPMFFPRVLWS